MTIYKNPKFFFTDINNENFYGLINPFNKNGVKIITKEQHSFLNLFEDNINLDVLSSISGYQVETITKMVNLFSKIGVLSFNSNFNSLEKNNSFKFDNIKKISFWIHITDTCNLRCTYCYISTKETFNTMEDKTLKQLEIKLIELKKKYPNIEHMTLKLSGGEVFSKFSFWKDKILKIKKNLKQHNLGVRIVCLTNMTILNDEIIKFLIDEDIGLGISLDGFEEYNSSRVFVNGKNSFETVKRNLLKLKENNISFGIMTVVSNKNLNGLVNLTKFLIENKLSFRFSDVKGENLDKIKFQKILEECYKLMEDNIGNDFSFKHQFKLSDLNINSPSEKVCSMGTSGAAVYLDGSIYFCHTHFGVKEPIGSLFDEKNDLLEAIHKGNKYLGELSEECDECMYKLICAGACPVYRVNGKSPECELFKQTIPHIYNVLAKERLHNLKKLKGYI